MLDNEGRTRLEDRDYHCFSGGVGGIGVSLSNGDEPVRARGTGDVRRGRSSAPVSGARGGDRDGDIVLARWGFGGASTDTRPAPDFASCFLPGTRILTPHGERAIENLRVGDLVTTPSGHRPIKFIPRQTFRRAPGENWAKGVAPIRVEAGAFGKGLPHRPLLVSPFHAFYLGGVLIEARRLVDGSTVRLADHGEDLLEYFNVELDDHDLIRANGVLVETYRPSHILARETFDNFVDYVDRYPGEAYRSFPACAPYAQAEPAKGRRLAMPPRVRLEVRDPAPARS